MPGVARRQSEQLILLPPPVALRDARPRKRDANVGVGRAPVLSWPAMTIYCRGAERLCAGVLTASGFTFVCYSLLFSLLSLRLACSAPPHGGAFASSASRIASRRMRRRSRARALRSFASINLGLYKHPYGHESFVVIIQVGDIRLCALFEISSYLSFHYVRRCHRAGAMPLSSTRQICTVSSYCIMYD